LVEQLTEPIRAAFLVSAFAGPISFPPYSGMIPSFFASELDWIHIRKTSRAWHLYHADNDLIVPLALGSAAARNLNVTMSLIPGGGHLNLAAGFVRFDALLGDVLTIADVGGSSLAAAISRVESTPGFRYRRSMSSPLNALARSAGCHLW
jgi:predicted alpha/beta hydrolase family esterase